MATWVRPFVGFFSPYPVSFLIATIDFTLYVAGGSAPSQEPRLVLEHAPVAEELLSGKRDKFLKSGVGMFEGA